MFGILLTDLKRSFWNYGFWTGCVLLSFILLRCIFPVFETPNVYPVMEICAAPMALSGFTVFAAAFPSWAYAGQYYIEKKSGYFFYIRSRMSLGNYLLMRLITVMISGGMIIALPLAILFSISYSLGTHEIGSLFWGTNVYETIKKFGIPCVLLIKTILGFLYGAFWALAAFLTSLFLKDYYVVLLAPFILHQFLWVLLEKYPMWNPIFLVRGEDLDSYGKSAIILFVYCCMVSLLIVIRIYYQEANAKT